MVKTDYVSVYTLLDTELREAKYKRRSDFISHVYMMQGALIDQGTNSLNNEIWAKMADCLLKNIYDKQ